MLSQYIDVISKDGKTRDSLHDAGTIQWATSASTSASRHHEDRLKYLEVDMMQNQAVKVVHVRECQCAYAL